MTDPFRKLPLPKEKTPRFIAVFLYVLAGLLLWPFLLGFIISRWIWGRPMKTLNKTAALSAVILSTLFVGTAWAAVMMSPGVYALPLPSLSPSASVSLPGATARPMAVVEQIQNQTATPMATVPPTATPTPAPTPQQAASFVPASKTTGCHEADGLPDAGCNPGATDPRVTQANIKSTICVSGYTSTVRPSSSYTNNLKVQQIKAYGYSDTSLSSYEEDHLVSLELGGSPDSAANLWPEPYGGTYTAKDKDKLENWLHSQVCNGSLTLATAQYEIANNWVTAYNAHYGSLSGDAGVDNDDTAPTPVPTAVATPRIVPTAIPAYNPSNPPVKMSNTKICHAQGDAYYGRTIHFTPYVSMDACVVAGGRPSER